MWKRISHEEFMRRFMDKDTSKYFEIIWEYIHSKLPIKVKCKTCWKEYMYSVAKELLWTTRKWCPDCRRKNFNKPIKKLNDINDNIENNWFVCIEYNIAKEQSTYTCKKCWRKYKRYSNNIIKKEWYQYCRLCSWASKWERIVAKILDNLSIPYRFNTTINWHWKYRFDFILDELNLIIEIDWDFHRKQLYDRSCFTWRTYKEVQKRDAIKDKIAYDNWYNLIRLIYWNRDKNLSDFFKEIYNKLWLFIDIENLNFSIFDLFIL